MNWSEEKGISLYDTMVERGLKMPEREFWYKTECCTLCLRLKIAVENTLNVGKDSADKRIDSYLSNHPIPSKVQKGCTFYGERKKECSKCQAPFENTETTILRLERLERDLFFLDTVLTHERSATPMEKLLH